MADSNSAKTREQEAPADKAGVEDYLALSAACVKQGAIDDAIATLRAAHDAIPHHLGVPSNLGGLLSRRASMTRRSRSRRRPRNPQPRPRPLQPGGRPGGADQLAAAVEHFERSIAIKPDLAEAHRGLGDALLDLDRLSDAAAAYERAVMLRRDPARPPKADAPLHSNRSRLRHDAEQFRYLVALGRLPAELGEVAACYESVAAFLSEPNLGSPTAIVPRELAAMIRPTYDRLLHRPTAEAVPEGALNPRLDVGRIEADYLNNGRGIASFDGLLSAEALARLLAFSRERPCGSTAATATAISAPSSTTGFVARCWCRSPRSCGRPCRASSAAIRCSACGPSSTTAAPAASRSMPMPPRST